MPFLPFSSPSLSLSARVSKLVSSDSNSVVAPDVRNDVLHTLSIRMPRACYFSTTQ